MFYSHQLLSKKGPLGQIWIAATMKANMNRKKTEEIDIEDICMQILEPEVPLALRLSGILMGGVVLIFRRKVKFLHDDVNELLLKVKTAMSAKTNDTMVSVSLPQGKSHAKYENVTISYNFDIFDDIERPLLYPSTPEARDDDPDVGARAPDDTFYDEYIIVGKPPINDADAQKDDEDHLMENRFQADIGDITLDDVNISSDDLNSFCLDIQDERFPTVDHNIDFGISTSDPLFDLDPSTSNLDHLWAPSKAPRNNQEEKEQGDAPGGEVDGLPQEEPLGIPREEPLGIPREEPLGIPREEHLGVPQDEPLGVPPEEPLGVPPEEHLGVPPEEHLGVPPEEPLGVPPEEPLGVPQEEPPSVPEEHLRDLPSEEPLGQREEEIRDAPEQEGSCLNRKSTSTSDVQASILPPSPQPAEVEAPGAPGQSIRKRRRARQAGSIYDVRTEISAKEFEGWLRNTEDIVGRQRQKSYKDHSRTLMMQKLIHLPSTGVSLGKKRPFRFDFDWEAELTNSWDANFGFKTHKPDNNAFSRRQKHSNNINQANVSGSKSNSSSTQQPGTNFLSTSSSEIPRNVDTAAPVVEQREGNNFSKSSSEVPPNMDTEPLYPQNVDTAPPIVEQTQLNPHAADGSNSQAIAGKRNPTTNLESAEKSQEAIRPDFDEFGSVEKLRAALRTPSTGSEDYGYGSQRGVTPTLRDQLHSNTSSGGKFRATSTPASGKLPFDTEREPYASGESGRSKKPGALPSPLELDELPGNDYYPEVEMPVPNFAGSSRDKRTASKTTPSQFELLETGPSAQLHQEVPIFLDNSTLKVLQFFRQSFDDAEEDEESFVLDKLADGMDKSESAKLFSKVLVLASNNYLRVSQDKSYGDIAISRGTYM